MQKVEQICIQVSEETEEVVVPANYNCPGQIVISGSIKGVEIACERLKAAGAKRALDASRWWCFSFTVDGAGPKGIAEGN